MKREQILEELWGQNDYFLGRSMDVFISRLGKYLQAEHTVSLETKRGVGFILKVSSTPLEILKEILFSCGSFQYTDFLIPFDGIIYHRGGDEQR